MISNSKKRYSLSHISEPQNEERSNVSEALEEPCVKKKRIWTSAELLKQMTVTSEELKYRKRRIKLFSSIRKCEKYFKCTKCQRSFKHLTENSKNFAVHPFLKVIFCKKCLEFYEDGEFSMDSNDGEEKYCRWCGEGGLMYSCCECASGFCTSCIKKHFGIKYNNNVKRNSNWRCFMCFPKPLWFLRLICSIAEEKTSHKSISPSPNSKEQTATVSGEKLKKKDICSIESNSTNGENTSRKIEDDESSTCCSVIISDTKESLSEIVVLNTPTMKKGIKRKHILESSSDESDSAVCKESERKKAKSRDSTESNSNKRSSDQNIVSAEVLEKLERILRLAEYQMGFGVSWSSKMLTKLFKPNVLNSPAELKNECQKIKWFFSILSTYLIESCSSVDAIEKSIENDEKIVINSPEIGHQGDYSAVVKFLDFVTNQVKVFLEKGIRLQDLLEGEIYYDNEIIGVKVRPNSTTSTPSASQTSTPKGTVKRNEVQISDGKCSSGEKTSDEESIVPSMEAEAEESSDGETKKRHSLSDPMDYLEDAEEQKSKIEEILSILENA